MTVSLTGPCFRQHDNRHALAFGAILAGRERQMPTAPDHGNAAGYFVDRHASEGRGGAVVSRAPGRTLPCAPLSVAPRRFAGALRSAGVARERRIALLLLD